MAAKKKTPKKTTLKGQSADTTVFDDIPADPESAQAPPPANSSEPASTGAPAPEDPLTIEFLRGALLPLLSVPKVKSVILRFNLSNDPSFKELQELLTLLGIES